MHRFAIALFVILMPHCLTATVRLHYQPSLLTYDIVEINDQDVQAKVNDVIEPKKIVFEIPIAMNEELPQKVEMVLSGDLQGVVSRKRSNAMLYTLNNNYRYLAELKLGEISWSMQMTISHISSSSPL